MSVFDKIELYNNCVLSSELQIYIKKTTHCFFALGTITYLTFCLEGIKFFFR